MHPRCLVTMLCSLALGTVFACHSTVPTKKAKSASVKVSPLRLGAGTVSVGTEGACSGSVSGMIRVGLVRAF